MIDTNIHESPYEFYMRAKHFKIACHTSLSSEEVQTFINLAQNGYRYRLYLDDLPSATVVKDKESDKMKDDFAHGIPIGEWDPIT